MHARKASLADVSDDGSATAAVEWLADGDYADIRYELSREPGIAKITICRPEVQTRSGRRPSSRCRTP
jgi:1,4-dihydroxy-2-naphthoyl-CoA synthase